MALSPQRCFRRQQQDFYHPSNVIGVALILSSLLIPSTNFFLCDAWLWPSSSSSSSSSMLRHLRKQEQMQHEEKSILSSTRELGRKQAIGAAAVILASQILLAPLSPASAFDSPASPMALSLEGANVIERSISNAIKGDDIDIAKQLQSTYGLSAPTEERPQITMGGRGAVAPTALQQQQSRNKFGNDSNQKRSPLMQGLVYLANPSQERPNPSDTLVLTATSPSKPDEILLGSKLVVAKAPRFPFQFSLYEENILKNKQNEWLEASTIQKEDGNSADDTGEGGDILVTARVCPEDVGKLPCTKEESTFFAQGISKLLGNLPGMNENDVVRTAVSLPLRAIH